MSTTITYTVSRNDEGKFESFVEANSNGVVTKFDVTDVDREHQAMISLDIVMLTGDTASKLVEPLSDAAV